MKIIFSIVLSFFSFVYRSQSLINVTSFEGGILAYSDSKFFDCDKDNDLDLIVSGSVFGSNSFTVLYENLGDNLFNSSNDNSLPAISFSDLSYSDIDMDGDLDLFTSGKLDWSDGVGQFYLNDGSCHFTDGQTIGMLYMGDSKFFDADNDGDEDLMCIGSSSTLNDCKGSLYINNGSGSFTLSTTSNFEELNKGSVEISDVDNDGDNDVLLSGYSYNEMSGLTKLYFNDGTGVFDEDLNQTFVGQCFGKAIFLNIDTDDFVDIFVMGYVQGVNLINKKFYLNDGNGNFTDVGDRGVFDLKQNMMDISDVDLDGDFDIFVSGRTIDNIDTCGLFLNNNGYYTRDSLFNSLGLWNGTCVFGNINETCGEELFYCGGNTTQCNPHAFLFNNESTIVCSDSVPDTNPTPIDLQDDIIGPNPIINTLFIRSFSDVDYYKLFDEAGRLVYESVYENSISFSIEFEKLARGFYTLEYGNVNRIKNVKLVYAAE